MEIVPNPSETYALDTPPGSTIAETATEHSSEPVSPPRRFGDISGILADSAFAQALADEARPLVNATAQGIQAMSDAPSALRQAIDPLVPRVATLEMITNTRRPTWIILPLSLAKRSTNWKSNLFPSSASKKGWTSWKQAAPQLVPHLLMLDASHKLGRSAEREKKATGQVAAALDQPAKEPEEEQVQMNGAGLWAIVKGLNACCLDISDGTLTTCAGQDPSGNYAA